MPVERAVRRRRPVTLTPLIDIIFLLLLFFMLSSTFTRFAEVPLANAASGATGDGPPPLFLQLGRDRLRLNGEEVDLPALPDALSRHAPDDRDGSVTLLVTLGEEVTSQDLVDLLVTLRSQPWLAVSVLG